MCTEDNELNVEILKELLKIESAECTICENGYEVTMAIRRSSYELEKTIPIIFMTANAFSEDIQHSLALGINAPV